MQFSLGSLEGGGGIGDSGVEISNKVEAKRSIHCEISVACLQHKIVQIENNYSTHEELQATMQELTNLKHQLEEIQSENRTRGTRRQSCMSLCASRRRSWRALVSFFLGGGQGQDGDE